MMMKMPNPTELVAGGLGNQAGQIAEQVVSGIGTLLGGLDAVVNPQWQVPPFIGMASADFMNLGLTAIMASNNTNLQFAKNQAVERGYTDVLSQISEAEGTRHSLVAKFGAKARANASDVVGAKPTTEEVKEFYTSCNRLIAAQNTQASLLKVYKEHLQADNAVDFDWRGLLKKIVNGVSTVFKYADKAKTIFEKAKPFLENL